MKAPGKVVTTGLLFGIGGAYLAMVGLLETFQARPIVFGVLNLGHAVLLALGLACGATAAARVHAHGLRRFGAGLVAGLVGGALVALLQWIVAEVPIRQMFIAASPAMRAMLAFGFAPDKGALAMLVAGAASGAVGALLWGTRPWIRRAIIAGLAAVVIAGVFQELIQLVLQYGGIIGWLRNFLYTWQGLRPEGAVALFIVVCAVSLVATRMQPRDYAPSSAERRRKRYVSAGIALVILALLPLLAGAYIGEVLMMVGLYILMGMGLNLEVGLAGLLDLGFVAFFAFGAYAMALLTSGSPIALLHLSFWQALPLAILISVLGGILFGLPVLGVRGDYLALATLGLGEIVRIIVLSDFAKPLLGGPQGILQIPKPVIGSFVLGSPVDLFYLTLVCAGIAAFVAWRLETSRLGRAWTALRDDEDVAQALGVNLIRSKLLAYGLGAAFGGLGGAIFAAMLGSVFPSSFELLISINVLALIIVGGMASLPGVMLGAIVLIGLPELLREFGVYRYLFYGAALVVMMRFRPEGLWPSEVRARELHAAEMESR